MARLSWVTSASLLSVAVAVPAWGQGIVVDGTLGVERSRLSGTDTVLIEGGTVRGPNLFHSFEAFGVEAGQAVYFSEPVGIEQIFGRVTGDGVSRIDGTLGVQGAADLFLLNPNGVIFGPGAQLDVSGTFGTGLINEGMGKLDSELISGDRDALSPMRK